MYNLIVSSFKESENGFNIELDIPGISKEDLELNVNHELLELKADRKFINGRTKNIYKKMYLSQDIDASKIEATMSNGVLSLRLPKKENTRFKRIQIK